jgi:hypothetical protein
MAHLKVIIFLEIILFKAQNLIINLKKDNTTMHLVQIKERQA